MSLVGNPITCSIQTNGTNYGLKVCGFRKGREITFFYQDGGEELVGGADAVEVGNS